MTTLPRTLPTSRLVVLAGLHLGAVGALAGCDCGGASPASESTEAPASETASPGEGERAEGTEARPLGPLGRVVAGFDDATASSTTLVLRRTRAVHEDEPPATTPFGTVAIGGLDADVALVTSTPVEGRTATLFGPTGTCAATIARTLTLRIQLEGHEPAPYDALEVRGCPSAETTYPFGVEGEVSVIELSSRTMEPAPEAVRTAVAELESEAGGDEEMDLLARAIPELGVTVVSGWNAYVVRGSDVVATFESAIPGAVHLGGEVDLFVRTREGLDLRTMRDGALVPVPIDVE